MKYITTLLLTTFITLGLYAQSGLKRPSVYFSTYLGYVPDDDSHASANLSLGYQISDFVGLGLSAGAHTELDVLPESFSSIALQYRITPDEHFIISADLGTATNYSKADDCLCELTYLSKFYPYFKVNAGYRFKKAFTLGIGFFTLPKVEIEVRNYDIDIEGNQVFEEPHIVDYMMSAFQFTLGVQIN